MFENFDREDIFFNRKWANFDHEFGALYPPATIKILIVADGGINFGLTPTGFTLRKAIEVLKNEKHQDYPSYARFEITTKDRTPITNPATPKGFTFEKNSLMGFDQLWLFGILAGNKKEIPENSGKFESQTYLEKEELLVISDFMNSGGGVLAMGDHEDLGLGLCAGVPRVRNMRKWWFEGEIPAGQSKAPDSDDLTRNDTVQLVGGVDPTSTGESDEKPQPVVYKPYYKSRYSNAANTGRFHIRPYSQYPHPVLCGPLGPITVFPDHPHEGECVIPQNLGLYIDTSDGVKTEYPGNTKPDIIATGYNVVGRTKSSFTITEPRSFGLLGAYDGHEVANQHIGRVLVDSTWHHWLDLNLVGIEAGASQDDGSDDSPDWRQIQAYFRNCAIWLAPVPKQSNMLIAAMMMSHNTYPIIKDYSIWKDRARINPTAEFFHHTGHYSLDALERVTTKCARAVWLYEYVVIAKLESIFDRNQEIIEQLKPRSSKGVKTDDQDEVTQSEASALAVELCEDAIVTPLFGASILAFWQHVEELNRNQGSPFGDPEERLNMLQEAFIKIAGETVNELLPMMLDFAKQRLELTEKRCSGASEAIANLKLG